jgi:CRISPR system Cascade subunit CasD
MSFGGTTVDQRNVTELAPTLSMLTGLLGNALGYDHGEPELQQRLQQRLRFAVRCDRRGELLVDYQTVDLGQDFLQEGWTTRGTPAGRRGGEASTGTHIRYRHYLANAVFTVALRLEPADEEPTIGALEAALRQPERPLFIGRKACVPAGPVLLGRAEAADLLAGLLRTPLHPQADRDAFAAWWPAAEDVPQRPESRLRPVADERDWENQIHTGRRFLWEGRIGRSELLGD